MKAALETRNIWKSVIDEVKKVDSIIAYYCRPECEYRGFCPEIDGCGLKWTK